MLLNVNQDMVGARQSLGGRVQYALAPALEPAPRPRRRDGERAHRGARRQHLAAHHARHEAARSRSRARSLAVKGSREPFHARMVPYYDSTDHHAFTPAPHRRARHQPHQLARRVHPLHRRRPRPDRRHPARAQRGGGGRGGALLRERGRRGGARRWPPTSAARGRSRGWPPTRPPRSPTWRRPRPPTAPAAFRAARNLVRQSHRRERAALALGAAAGRRAGRAGPARAAACSQLERRSPRDLGALERGLRWPSPARPRPQPGATAEEDELAALVYVRGPDIGAYQDAMDEGEAGGRPALDDAVRGLQLRRRAPDGPARSTRRWPRRRSPPGAGTTGLRP